MNNHNTHLIQNYPSNKPSRSILSRMDDGAIIGVREGNSIAWGEDPRAQQGRSYRDQSYAMAALRKVADADVIAGLESRGEILDLANPPSARIEEIDGESRIARVQ